MLKKEGDALRLSGRKPRLIPKNLEMLEVGDKAVSVQEMVARKQDCQCILKDKKKKSSLSYILIL